LRAASGFDALREVFARVHVLEETADGVNVLVGHLDPAYLMVSARQRECEGKLDQGSYRGVFAELSYCLREERTLYQERLMRCQKRLAVVWSYEKLDDRRLQVAVLQRQ